MLHEELGEDDVADLGVERLAGSTGPWLAADHRVLESIDREAANDLIFAPVVPLRGCQGEDVVEVAAECDREVAGEL